MVKCYYTLKGVRVMLLYFVRHGDPIYSPDSLTELGHNQAEAVAKRLALHGVDKIYASTSNRAMQTAEPLSKLIKKEIIPLDWCHEDLAAKEFFCTFGDKTFWLFGIKEARKLLNSPDVLSLGKEWYRHEAFPEKVGSGIKRIDFEADKFLSELGYVHNRESNTYFAQNPSDKRIALFSHQGFGLAFLSSVLDIPYPLFATHFDVSHSSVTVIEFPNCEGEIIPTVLQLSNDSHIYKEGIPTSYNNRILF